MRLTISRKLGLSSLAYSLPIAVLFAVYVGGIRSDLAFSRSEVEGLEVIAPAGELMAACASLARSLEAGEDLPSSALAGPTEAFPALASARARWEGDLALGDAALEATGKPELGAQILAMDWEELRASPDEAALRDFARRLRGLVAYVGDSSNLILDPDLDSYYLMDLVVVALPDCLVHLDELASAETGARGGYARDRAGILLSEVDFPRIADDGAKALAQDAAFYGPSPGLQAGLPPLLAAAATAGLPALTRPGRSEVEAAASSLASLWAGGVRELSTLLGARMAKFRRDLGLGIGVTLVALDTASSIQETTAAFARMSEAVTAVVQASAQGEASAGKIGSSSTAGLETLKGVEAGSREARDLSAEITGLAAGLLERTRSVSQSIQELSDFSGVIRESLGEQTEGSRLMTRTIAELQEAAESNSRAATAMAETASDLAGESSSLNAVVGEYET